MSMLLSQASELINPSEEHRILRDAVRDFVKAEVEPQALEHDRQEKFNLPLFTKLGSMGLLGLTVPEAYGGTGMDAVAAVLVCEELASSDPGFTLAYLAHSFLCANNLAVNGSEEQKLRWLPKLCAGTSVGAMAMSEPDVGTDVLDLRTTAEYYGSHYVIDGRKMWITNGCIDDQGTPADVVWVYARTNNNSEPSAATATASAKATEVAKAAAKSRRPSISTFVVESGQKGYAVGQKIRDKTGMRASNTAELVFDQCRVEVNQRIGEEGQSLHHMMRNLEIERLTLAAMSLGIARRSLEIMVNYSKERQAFGHPLHYFGQIQRHIAESYAEWRACQTYIYDTARNLRLDHGGHRLDCDGAKLLASTCAKNIADRAIQVLGGYGYVGEYVVERLWRDAKLLEIGGGTLEAHQKNMVRDLVRD